MINNNSYHTRTSQVVVSLFVIAAVLFSVTPLGAQSQRKPAGLSEEQRILHVLNRLGFGARPGDIARVKAMGVENYINQQLSPN